MNDIPKFKAFDKAKGVEVEVWAIGWKAWDEDGGINYVEVCDDDGTYTLMDEEVILTMIK